MLFVIPDRFARKIAINIINPINGTNILTSNGSKKTNMPVTQKVTFSRYLSLTIHLFNCDPLLSLDSPHFAVDVLIL